MQIPDPASADNSATLKISADLPELLAQEAEIIALKHSVQRSFLKVLPKLKSHMSRSVFLVACARAGPESLLSETLEQIEKLSQVDDRILSVYSAAAVAGNPSPEAAKVVLRGYESASRYVRGMVHRAAIENPSRAFVAALANAAGEDHVLVRECSAIALRSSDDKTKIDSLKILLRDEDSAVQSAAAESLANSDQPEARTLLYSTLAAPQVGAMVKIAIVSALLSHPREGDLAELKARFLDLSESLTLRRAVSTALKDAALADAVFEESCFKLFEHETDATKYLAASCLRGTNLPPARAALLDLARSKDPFICKTAINSLQEIRSTAEIGEFRSITSYWAEKANLREKKAIKALNDTGYSTHKFPPTVLKDITLALIRSPLPEARTLFEELLTHSKPIVRLEILAGLMDLGADEFALFNIASICTTMLNDPENDIQRQSAILLSRLPVELRPVKEIVQRLHTASDELKYELIKLLVDTDWNTLKTESFRLLFDDPIYSKHLIAQLLASRRDEEVISVFREKASEASDFSLERIMLGYLALYGTRKDKDNFFNSSEFSDVNSREFAFYAVAVKEIPAKEAPKVLRILHEEYYQSKKFSSDPLPPMGFILSEAINKSDFDTYSVASSLSPSEEFFALVAGLFDYQRRSKLEMRGVIRALVELDEAFYKREAHFGTMAGRAPKGGK